MEKTILTMLFYGYKKLLEIHGNGREIVKEGGAFGELNNDPETRADQVMGGYFRDSFRMIPGVKSITVEGQDPMLLSGDGSLHVFIDPLDGSLNYKLASSFGALPYTAVITVFEKRDGVGLTYNDVVLAAVMDYRTGNVCLTKKANTGLYETWLPPDIRCRVLLEKKIDLGRQIVIGEMYYLENRKLLGEIFAGDKGWLRNPGSAAFEMALVATGVATAYICDRQKNHELAAGAALVIGAGGVAVDFEGRDLLGLPYDFYAQQPVVLAASPEIAEEILNRVKRIRIG